MWVWRAWAGRLPREILPDAMEVSGVPLGRKMVMGRWGRLRVFSKWVWVVGRYMPEAPVSEI